MLDFSVLSVAFCPKSVPVLLNMPVSEVRRCKEELLKVLRELGAQYGVARRARSS